MGADSEVDGIVFLAQAVELRAVDGTLVEHVDAAVQDPVDLGLEALPGQAIARNAVTEHAAEVLALLEDGHVMPHDREVVRAAQAGRAAAHDGDVLVRRRREPRPVVALHVLGGEALELEDVQRVVDHAAAAVHLAGVLAHEAAHERQRVVLADKLHCVSIAAVLDERDVARDVHVSRAAAHAGGLLGALLKAAGVLADVVLEVVAEALDGGKRHLARFEADGAVTREIDRARGLLDMLERLVVGAPLKDVLQQVVQGAQAHAARRALATALRGAKTDERRRELNRTRRERAHGQAPPQGVVQVVHDDLGAAPLHNMESCHRNLPSQRQALTDCLHN